MKKLLMGFAASALILTSCSNVETLESVSNNMIGFGSISDRLPSRAEGANDAKSDFRVLAQLSNKTDNWYMNSEVDGTTFSYTPVMPWPVFNANSLTFYAYAPFDAITAPDINAGSPSGDFDYTVPVNADVDLTIAASQTFSASAAKVNLVFSHMLSRVQLGDVELVQSLQDAGYSVDLTNATLKISAEFTGGSNNIFTPSEWTSLTGSHTLYSGATNYYIMPHDIPDNTTTIVKLENVKIMNGTFVHFEGDIKAEYVPATALIGGKFTKSTRYTVNFTIGTNAKEEAPDPDDNDPDKEGPGIFGANIEFGATNVEWLEEPINVGLGN